jgi:hypothetical protein
VYLIKKCTDRIMASRRCCASRILLKTSSSATQFVLGGVALTIKPSQNQTPTAGPIRVRMRNSLSRHREVAVASRRQEQKSRRAEEQKSRRAEDSKSVVDCKSQE